MLVASTVLILLTIFLVLHFAAVEGNVPKWAMPPPLSFAGSAGRAREAFRWGLQCAAIMMTLTVPAILAAYSCVIATIDRDQHNSSPGVHMIAHAGLLTLRPSLLLCVVGFFLQAAVPFDKKALEQWVANLRGFGAWNVFHAFAACLLFASSMIVGVAIITVSGCSHILGDLQLPFWWRLFFLRASAYVGMNVANCFADGDYEWEDEDIDEEKKSGAVQIGLLSSMLALMATMALDVLQICRRHQCDLEHFDVNTMYAVLLFFVIAAFGASRRPQTQVTSPQTSSVAIPLIENDDLGNFHSE